MKKSEKLELSKTDYELLNGIMNGVIYDTYKRVKKDLTTGLEEMTTLEEDATPQTSGGFAYLSMLIKLNMKLELKIDEIETNEIDEDLLIK